MPMFESDEEFEAYVAKQQQELAEDADSHNPSATGAAKPKGALEKSYAAMALVIPIALLAIVGFFVWNSTPDSRNISNDPWDNILGTAAWATGREYNADANSLTERLTLRLPEDERGEEKD